MVCCVLYGIATAFSQGTNLGTIRGTVVDQKGDAVPNASVKVTDLATNVSRDLTTSGIGDYEAAGLKPGNYRVTVTAPGFKTTAINAVLTGSDVVRADAKLEVGDASAIVSVTSEAGLIETDTPTISGTINNRHLIELPRDSRDIYQFLYLNPNITQGEASGSFKYIGAQSYGAAFSLDGQRSNGGIFGEPTASQPSLEAIGELTVLSNNFTAEYAGIANIRVDTKRGQKDFHGSGFYNNKNSALAAWSLGDKIDQANFVPSFARPDFPKPYFNLNETGGSLNGPIPGIGKNRTFFTVAYERRWQVSPFRFAARNSVPSQPLLSGDFSGLADSRKPTVPAEVLPLLTPQELAANTILVGTSRRFITIPQRLLNPSVSKLISTYFPTSSRSAPIDAIGRLSDFAQNTTARLTRDLLTTRIDHDFSSNDRIYGVYNYQKTPSQTSSYAGVFPAFGLLLSDRRNHTFSLSYTHLFSSHLINEARGGFNNESFLRHAPFTLRQYLTSSGFSDADITSVGAVLGSSALDTFGQTALFVGSYASITNGGRSVNRRLDQKLITFGDTLTWVTGRHTFKGGGDVVRNRGTDGFVANRGNPRGRINYTGSTSGNNSPTAFARFLIGLSPNTVNFVDRLRGQLDATNFEYGFFFQDDFRVSPKVTLNLGIRYELITPFVDSDNLLVNFDPSFTDPTTKRKGHFVVPTADVIPLIDPRIVNYGVVTAKEAGVSRGLVNTDTNNFAPRLGISWRLTDKTVLRGGYGFFYPTSAAQGIRDALASAPFNQGLTKSGAVIPLGGWPGGLTPPGITPFSGGRLNTFDNTPTANNIPFDLQQPRIEQFNATFEHELAGKTGIRVSYLGTRMHGLIGGIDLNLLPPSATPFGTRNDVGDPCVPDDGDCTISAADAARRPFPELGSFLASYKNFGNGRSHALQVEVNRRFVNGLTFNASYTLLDQKGSGFDTGNSSLGGTSYNQFNPNNDFARDAFVSRHRFVSYGMYELPFGKGRQFGNDMPKWADAAFGGFQLSWNMFAKSGTGFTPYWECGNCDPVFPGNIGSEFLDAVGGFNGTSFRPVVLSANQYIKKGDQFFNPAAFGPPTVGADALDNPNLARRNILTGPGTWGVNLGLHKFFKIKENVQLEVGADFDNVFNHPLRSPADINFAHLGVFFLDVDPVTAKLLPITRFDPDPDFGRTVQSFTQEGIDNRRTIRLRLRLSF
jgi:hypothetical protein